MKIVIAILAAFAAVQDTPVSPDVWVHEGDADGDGLTDEFEIAHGLDPDRVSSFADGVADENRLDASGKTLWEVQQAEGAASHGANGCGLTGIEAAILLYLASRSRRVFSSSRAIALQGRTKTK